jgi:hypothetical protein
MKAWFVRGKRKQIIKGMKQLIYGIPEIANIGAGYEEKNGLINI